MIMTTQFIGIKDFRQNLARYTKQAQKKKIQYIVLRKNVPVFRVSPLDEKAMALEKLVAGIAESEDQIKNGEYYTQEEMFEMITAENLHKETETGKSIGKEQW